MTAWIEEQGLSLDTLEQVLASLNHRSIDFADIYLQDQVLESWSLEDGIVRDAGYSHDQGAGVRVNSGEQVGFAYTDDLTLSALLASAKAASGIAARVSPLPRGLSRLNEQPLYTGQSPFDAEPQTRVQFLKEMDAYVRALDPRVQEVTLSLVAQHEKTAVVNTLGVAAGDLRPLVRFGVSVIVREGDRRERGNAGGGGRITLEQLMQSDQPQEWARKRFVWRSLI